MTDAISTFASTARVPTTKGSRYLQQLCKHWSHNLEVEFDTEHGRIVFPRDARGASWASDGVATLDAEPDNLVCRIVAGEAAQLEGLKGALQRHVDRFAFREAPLAFEWVDG